MEVPFSVENSRSVISRLKKQRLALLRNKTSYSKEHLPDCKSKPFRGRSWAGFIEACDNTCYLTIAASAALDEFDSQIARAVHLLKDFRFKSTLRYNREQYLKQHPPPIPIKKRDEKLSEKLL